MSEQPWLIDIYDEYVASQPLGASVEESREAVSRAYAEAVESGSMPRWEEDLETEGRNLFDRLVKPVREQRKSAMVKRFEWILDAIMDGTLMEEWDPILSRAYRWAMVVTRRFGSGLWRTWRTRRPNGSATPPQ